jgi:hypothetical protein
MQELPAADTIPSPAVSNIISSPTTIAADTSYIVLGYLNITSDLTISGNVGVL